MDLGAAPLSPDEILANTTPKSELGSAKAGTAVKASRMDHVHPTISWRGRVTLGADGKATVTFGRSFSAEPVIQLTAINPVGNKIVLEVESDIKTGDVWTAAVITGTRARALPTLGSVSGLLTAVITGINSVTTALSGFNLFTDPAAGVVVNVLVIEPSA